MKSFSQYITEMPYYLGNLNNLTADLDIEQRHINQDARRYGRKIGSVNGADFYLTRGATAMAHQEYEFCALKGDDRVIFYTRYEVGLRPFRFGVLKGRRYVTQTYIEFIDRSWDKSILLSVPMRFLAKKNFVLLSDKEHSTGGRNMWIRLMRNLSKEGYQVGWINTFKDMESVKPPNVDFDSWLDDNYHWGTEDQYEKYQYFILSKR